MKWFSNSSLRSDSQRISLLMLSVFLRKRSILLRIHMFATFERIFREIFWSLKLFMSILLFKQNYTVKNLAIIIAAINLNNRRFRKKWNILIKRFLFLIKLGTTIWSEFLIKSIVLLNLQTITPNLINIKTEKSLPKRIPMNVRIMKYVLC